MTAKRQNNYNTNLASEFLVMSILHRLGIDAHLTLGNKKAVDIVVVRAAGDTVTIDVKAVAGKVDWIVGNVPLVPRERHFVVLLTYQGKFDDLGSQPSAWVVPHSELLKLVRVVRPPSTMRYLWRKEVLALTQYSGAWDLLRASDHGPTN